MRVIRVVRVLRMHRMIGVGRVLGRQGSLLRFLVHHWSVNSANILPRGYDSYREETALGRAYRHTAVHDGALSSDLAGGGYWQPAPFSFWSAMAATA